MYIVGGGGCCGVRGRGFSTLVGGCYMGRWICCFHRLCGGISCCHGNAYVASIGWEDAYVGVVQEAYVASTGCGGISYCCGNWRLERDRWALWGRVLWWCIRKMM